MKNKVHTMLIKFQNRFGKIVGRVAWMEWKLENGIK